MVTDWWGALTAQHSSPLVMVGIALTVFPKLALGLSGFETGVAVMPQISGDPTGTPEHPAGRIRGTTRLLTVTAVVMSGFLLTSSLVTTLLIPQEEFQPGGHANGRALAYLAHAYLGNGFGTVYDISTILILWFAGASAMAGLLNLVPRYLPRYGMAPQWARAVRPLVLVFTAIAFLITIVFDADVDAQGGAYATGVLVLITSAAVAVTISAARHRHRAATVGFAVITIVFVYTTVLNVIERPDGIRIAGLFILGILVISFVSRSFQIRATRITFDDTAEGFLRDDAGRGQILIIAHEPGAGGKEEYRAKSTAERRDSHIPPLVEDPVPGSARHRLVRVRRGTAHARDPHTHGYRVLTVTSANVPNTLAAVLLQISDLTGVVPNAYFEWTEGGPVSNMLKYLLFGSGEVATVTREVLRQAEPIPPRRPIIHVA